VGMRKSASSISKVCAKGRKNSFVVFPMLFTDRHFHRLLRPLRILRGRARQSILPVAFELDWTDIVQR
jgi:hypothetical protein